MSERIVGQLQRLQRAETSRRELLANVSHDLRTPLASMQGYLETLLLRQGTLSPEEQRNYLEIASRHSERLGKLIHELFQLTKLEAHEIEPQFEPFSVTELVQDVVQKFQLAAGKRGLSLDSALTGEQVEVFADIALIETVLENLIENALRHTPKGGASVWRSSRRLPASCYASPTRAAASPAKISRMCSSATTMWTGAKKATPAAPGWDLRSSGRSWSCTVARSGSIADSVTGPRSVSIFP